MVSKTIKDVLNAENLAHFKGDRGEIFQIKNVEIEYDRKTSRIYLQSESPQNRKFLYETMEDFFKFYEEVEVTDAK